MTGGCRICISIPQIARRVRHGRRDEIGLEMTRVVLVQRAADDLLHLAIVQVDAWAEERSAACLRHDVRLPVMVDASLEWHARRDAFTADLAQISISDLYIPY